MKRIIWLLFLTGLAFIGYQVLNTTEPSSFTISLPETITITNSMGETTATQTGPLWVLLSGVDEHGLIPEHELTLLAEPDERSDPIALVHTGTAVAVQEIRYTGPQNLHRFYRVQTSNGDMGWMPAFYVRRVAYLYTPDSDEIPLYAAPGENEVARLPNISPVTVKDPTQPDWWIVQTPDGTVTGWVEAGVVKESSEPEFLLNQQHAHP
jgi:hypothetical protein